MRLVFTFLYCPLETLEWWLYCFTKVLWKCYLIFVFSGRVCVTDCYYISSHNVLKNLVSKPFRTGFFIIERVLIMVTFEMQYLSLLLESCRSLFWFSSVIGKIIFFWFHLNYWHELVHNIFLWSVYRSVVSTFFYWLVLPGFVKCNNLSYASIMWLLSILLIAALLLLSLGLI